MVSTGKTIDYEINKSLDELVSEDHSMRQGKGSHFKRGAGAADRDGGSQHSGQQGAGGYRGGQGHRGGRFRGNEDRDFKGASSRFEERGPDRRTAYSGSQRKAQDEREVSGEVEMRDAYGKNVAGKRVFISNLAFETQWKYLKDHMRQAGDVVRADIFENKDGTSRGIGLVEFRTQQDAQRALSRLHETMLDGRKIYLKEDTQGHIFPPLQSKNRDFDFNNDNGAGPTRSFRDRRPIEEDSQPRGNRGGMNSRHHNNRSRSRSRSGSPVGRGGYRGSRGGGTKNSSENGHHRASKGRDSNPEQRAESPEPQRRLTIKKKGQKAEREDSSSEGRQGFSIHVSNLPYSVDKGQLKDAFTEFGKVNHSSVSLDEKGCSRGFGVVEFAFRDDAEQATVSMDKASFNGREVNVKFYDQTTV